VPKRAEQYIKDVNTGKQRVGKYIRLAIKRHLDDLKKSKKKDFPYFFSPTHAQGAIDSVEVQKLAYGEKSGEPFILMPWQATILYLAYGWRRKSNQSRRFLKAYIKVPRGNAKTEFLAAVGNIGFFFEDVKDPQIWWVSSTVTQSKIGFSRQKEMARHLIDEDPTFNELFGLRAERIYEKMGGGFVGFLSSRPQDGFSPSYGLVDEYHEFPNDERIHSLESGMIKRSNVFTWIITTAGTNPNGPCAEFEKRCKAMLDGSVENDQLLAFCYDLDETDDWTDPKNWPKVNPSWGVSVNPEIFKSEFDKAVSEGVVKENNFKTKNLNIWVASAQGWIRDEVFRAAGKKFDPSILDGKHCFGGLDLSLTDDMSALCLLFPSEVEGEKSHCIMYYWCTEKTAYERNRNDGIPYLQWAKDGYLKLIPGATIDFDVIKNDIRALYKKYKFHSCAIDPWRKKEIIIDLNDEFGKVPTQTEDFFEVFAQSAKMFTAPLSDMERAIKKKTLNHGHHPILEWNNRNVALYIDGNGNFKMDRKKSKEKIDGMVALGMAWGQWMTYKHDFFTPYSESDVFAL